MALSRNLQVLEISGLRLDQPLTHCGPLSPNEAQLVSEARFIAVERAIQKAIDRSAELVVLHSDILSGQSAGGRAPWFLARLFENCFQRGIAVVWVEAQHNAWMERFVATPFTLVRLSPGEVRRIPTRSGDVLFHSGRPTPQALHAWQDVVQATIGLDFGTASPLDRDCCDLVLQDCVRKSDKLEDFVASTNAGESHPLATLHTLRIDRANSCETLTVSPLGFTGVTCSWSADLSTSSLADSLGEEVDAAAGRYFASAPATQLLVVDLNIVGHGLAWDSLWSPDQRESLTNELNRRTRHPGCRVRSMNIRADGVEATRTCPFTPTLKAIWTETTARPSLAMRSLADLAPESLTLGEWARTTPISSDHLLAAEVHHACLHLLRSAS